MNHSWHIQNRWCYVIDTGLMSFSYICIFKSHCSFWEACRVWYVGVWNEFICWVPTPNSNILNSHLQVWFLVSFLLVSSYPLIVDSYFYSNFGLWNYPKHVKHIGINGHKIIVAQFAQLPLPVLRKASKSTVHGRNDHAMLLEC